MKTESIVNGILTAGSLGALAAAWFIRKAKPIEVIGDTPIASGVLDYIKGWEALDTNIVWDSYSTTLQERIKSNTEMFESEMTLLRRAKEAGMSYRNSQVIFGYISPTKIGYWVVKMDHYVNDEFHREIVWVITTDLEGKIMLCLL